MKILIINGPNLNMLGKRQPHIYGSETFEDILASLRAKYSDMDIHYFQSNSEGILIDRIQEAFQDEELKGMVVNLGAYTHYSYGLQDALGM
ncbi:MAG: type II 3-dehydroquinate dehydratase, partial [Bacteroidota bacterium]